MFAQFNYGTFQISFDDNFKATKPVQTCASIQVLPLFHFNSLWILEKIKAIQFFKMILML